MEAGVHENLYRFHGFSPLLKSLSVTFFTFPSLHALNLIYSFPLLENLSVTTAEPSFDEGGDPERQLATVQPPSLPMFTGSLKLALAGGMDPIVHQLLSLPSGLHFRKLDLTWDSGGDTSLTTALVERCCSTIESLRFDSGSMCMSSQARIPANG